MTQRLAPYGSIEQANNIAKVGKSKASESLASRMPAAEIAAKVGKDGLIGSTSHRVVRRNAK